MVKKKVKVVPNFWSAYHDEKGFTIEVALPGVRKEDVAVDVTSDGFCVEAPREDFEYKLLYSSA